MNTNSRTTKKRGRKTAGAVVAPLVLSLAFVAMTGLAPQYAGAAPVVIPNNTTSDGVDGVTATPTPAAGANQSFAINADGTAADVTVPATPTPIAGVSTDGVVVIGGAGGDGLVGDTTGPGGAAGTITVNAAKGVVLGDSTATVADSTITGGVGGTGGDATGANSGAVGGAGGQTIFTIGNTTTIYDTLSLIGGAGGLGGSDDGALAGIGGDGGAGGAVRLTDNADAKSITTVFGNVAVASGAGGLAGTPNGGTAGAGGVGGAANVDIAGTVKFVEIAAPDAHSLTFARGAANGAGATAAVHSSIGILEVAATQVQMGIAGLAFDAAPAATDNVDFGTLKLTSGGRDNGGVFSTTASLVNAYADNSLSGVQQYRVTNLQVTGLDNVLNTAGMFAPAATGGKVTFDVTGVHTDPTHAMLTTLDGDNIDPANVAVGKAERVDFTNFAPTVDHHGNPNLIITAMDKGQHRALTGHTVTLVDGATGWATSQWGAMNPGGTTANMVRYYDQIGTSRFVYDTFGADNGAAPDLLNAAALGEISASKAYSQYQAAAGETAADVFLNNTWVANRDVADITLPGTFGLTGRVSYFTINQDQDHKSDVSKDQLAAAIAGGYKMENGAGETTVGAFFEYGHGEYDTDTTVRGWGQGQGFFGTGSDKIKGDGDADLYGGGLFVFHDFMEGTYLDGGVRFGAVDQTFRIKGHGLDHRTKIDTDTNYWGLNFGAGHKFQLTNCANLDLYGKFLWTRLEDNTTTNGYGERVHFDAFDSIRTRIGARVNQGLGDGDLSVYYGAAWEQEWDGKATGSVDHVKIRDAADNSGASAFGELGLAYKPQGQNFAVEVGAFGLAGSQQGGGGTVGLKFDF